MEDNNLKPNTSPEKCKQESKRYDKILKLRQILADLSATAIEDPRYGDLFTAMDSLLSEDEEHFSSWVSGFNAEMIDQQNPEEV